MSRASDSPMSGSATYPTSRPVTVIPSWAPLNMKEVRRVIARVRWACASPLAAAAWSFDRSTAMYANSWATKKAVAAVIAATIRTPRSRDNAMLTREDYGTDDTHPAYP